MGRTLEKSNGNSCQSMESEPSNCEKQVWIDIERERERASFLFELTFSDSGPPWTNNKRKRELQEYILEDACLVPIAKNSLRSPTRFRSGRTLCWGRRSIFRSKAITPMRGQWRSSRSRHHRATYQQASANRRHSLGPRLIRGGRCQWRAQCQAQWLRRTGTRR